MSDDSYESYVLACRTQEQAALCFESGDEEKAVPIYRASCVSFRIAMGTRVSAEGMRRYLLALQALTVAAGVSGRLDEARLAAGTGLANAGIARAKWPGPVFDGIAADLEKLDEKLGGNCPVFLSDDPESWPYDN